MPHTQSPRRRPRGTRRNSFTPGQILNPGAETGTVSNQLHESPSAFRVTSRRAPPFGTLSLNNAASGKAGSLRYKEAILKWEAFFSFFSGERLISYREFLQFASGSLTVSNGWISIIKEQKSKWAATCGLEIIHTSWKFSYH